MKRKNYDTDKKLMLFFIATLLWTWACGFIPVFMELTDTSLGTFIFYFGGGAPSVVGLILVFVTYPRKAINDYFMRCLSFKLINLKYLLYTIIFFVLIAAVSILIATKILYMPMPGLNWVFMLMANPLNIMMILLLSFVSGPFNEEFGWRGYALDKLLVRYGFTWSSIILGFIWAIWHLAWYFTPGQAQYNLLQNSLFDALMYIPGVILLNFVVTFVYIKTKRSILSAALVHMASNLFTSQLIAPYSAAMGVVIRYVTMTFCIVLIIYACTSIKFKRNVQEEIVKIKSDAKEFDR